MNYDGDIISKEGSCHHRYRPSSPAENKRIDAGDTIVEIAQEAITNVNDFKSKVEKLKSENRKSALLLIADADGELRFIVLDLISSP
jgi:serine protease Do